MIAGGRGSAFVALLVALAAARVSACGHCKEDKIAATYDHAVVSRAHRSGLTVVFAEVRGGIAPGGNPERWLRRQIEAVAGVARGTARVSLDPAAISFACAPAQAGSALRAVGGRLGRRGLGVFLLEMQPARVQVAAGRTRAPR